MTNETKALVLDIDGTLTNTQKDITPATKAAVQNLMKKERLSVNLKVQALDLTV